MTDLNIQFEPGKPHSRMVTTVDGVEAKLTFYPKEEGVIVVDHTLVPKELGGKGVGKALVAAVVAHAREHDLKIVPQCSFVAAMQKRKPDWADAFVA